MIVIGLLDRPIVVGVRSNHFLAFDPENRLGRLVPQANPKVILRVLHEYRQRDVFDNVLQEHRRLSEHFLGVDLGGDVAGDAHHSHRPARGIAANALRGEKMPQLISEGNRFFEALRRAIGDQSPLALHDFVGHVRREYRSVVAANDRPTEICPVPPRQRN